MATNCVGSNDIVTKNLFYGVAEQSRYIMILIVLLWFSIMHSSFFQYYFYQSTIIKFSQIITMMNLHTKIEMVMRTSILSEN